MEIVDFISKTPWDSNVFGMDTYEIKSANEEVLKRIQTIPGHFTIKVDPLTSKKLLHEFGFYYCDTLIEPFCDTKRFSYFKDKNVKVTFSADIKDLIAISHGAFIHGRFHRDFNIDKRLADVRYDNWLTQLYDSRNVMALLYRGDPAGFIGFNGNKIVLQAVSGSCKGRGLSKYLWSAGCRELFGMGHDEICSSLSVSNVAALNLYASLGFRFRTPLDVYHRINLLPPG